MAITDIIWRYLGIDTMSGNKSKSMISLETIKEVMDIPVVAVKALAREAGIDDSDMQSECVDEDSLYVFSEAYVRKLKSFFNRMKRHSDQVGIDDMLAFENFCVQFKKPECVSAKAISWDDIDVDAIRDEFFAQVKEKSNKSFQLDDVDYASIADCCYPGIHNKFTYDDYIYQMRLWETTSCVNSERRQSLQRVTKCLLYHGRVRIKRRHVPLTNNVRQQQKAAHYYIYSTNDGKDHNEETVSNYEGSASVLLHVAA